MKRIVLVLYSLLFTFSANAQIEQFIQTYKDTSQIYSRWENMVKKSVDNIPKTGFYFEVIKEIEAHGNMVYSISDSRYQKSLDSTRISTGASPMKRTIYLDSIAEIRGIQLINKLIDSKGNIRDDMNTSKILETFRKEAHVGYSTSSENTHISLCKGGQMGLFTSPLGNYTSPELSLATLYTRMVSFTRKGFEEFNINSSWNNSPGHYKNRINPDFIESGYSIIVVEYNGNNGNKDRLIVAYEVFNELYNTKL